MLREAGHFTKQRLISEQLMLWKTSKSRKLHQESLSHIFKQIHLDLSFDFELYPSLLVAAQTFTSHFFVVVRQRENYRLN